MKKRIAKKKGMGIFSSFSPFRNSVAVLYGPPPIPGYFTGKRKKNRTEDDFSPEDNQNDDVYGPPSDDEAEDAENISMTEEE